MSRIACALFAVAMLGCTESESRFPVVISTMTDDGRPFPDVPVTLGKAAAGKTGADGRLSVNVRGKEGVKVSVSIDVPKGYRLSPGSPPSLVLRRLTDVAEGSRSHVLPVEHAIKLSPLVRQYAVLVRVGVPGLDVETFGTRQAVTNAQGVAMFLYQGAPGDELQVRVNTAGHPELRPQNPGSTFVLSQRSEAYVVKEKFAVYKAPVHHTPKPKFTGPRRL
jgi:hypothetical protein